MLNSFYQRGRKGNLGAGPAASVMVCSVPGCWEITDWRNSEPKSKNKECTVHFSNPWAGRLICHRCGSTRWTMPIGQQVPNRWRCLLCHLTILHPNALVKR